MLWSFQKPDIICNQIRTETLHQSSVFLSHVILIHFPTYERVRWTGILTVQVIYHLYSAQWIFSQSKWGNKFSFKESELWQQDNKLKDFKVAKEDQMATWEIRGKIFERLDGRYIIYLRPDWFLWHTDWQTKGRTFAIVELLLWKAQEHTHKLLYMIVKVHDGQ